MAQSLQIPNIEVQRTAKKRLRFLVGEWCGEASATRGPGLVVQLDQTEVAEYKLDGLVLVIEGVGPEQGRWQTGAASTRIDHV